MQGLHSGRFDALEISGKAKRKETLFGWMMENPVTVYPDYLRIPS